MFTWLWFLQIAKMNPHVDNWFWGQEGITCGKTESEPDCLNRQDWSVTEKTVEAIKNDQPTLTFIHFGRFIAMGKIGRKPCPIPPHSPSRSADKGKYKLEDLVRSS